MSDLKDKVVLITGGGRGLGFAIAQAVVELGGKVALLGRGLEALDQAVEKLGGDNAKAFTCDVSDKSSVEEAFNKAAQAFGGLDAVVNNAGLARPNKIADVPADELALQINTNLCGVIYSCQAAIPLLKERGGRIVNISSATVHHTNEMSHLGIYAATKAAVELVSRELAEELKDEDIYVTVVSPGAVMTEFGLGFDFDILKVALDAWQDKGKRFDGSMDAEDVGKAVAHCLTYPLGVAVDYMEIKPHRPSDKPVF